MPSRGSRPRPWPPSKLRRGSGTSTSPPRAAWRGRTSIWGAVPRASACWRSSIATAATARRPRTREPSWPPAAPGSDPASPSPGARLDDGQGALGVARPQHLLVELADARLRHLDDEGPALRKPPARDPLGQEALQRVDRGRGAGAQHDAGERPLLPAFVRHPHDRRFDDVRVCHDRILELDRRDPLAARLDHILRPVGDLDEAVRVDGADVARAQPAVVELVGRRILVVRGRDPRATDLDLARGLPVPGKPPTNVVDDADLDARDQASRLRPPLHL